MPPLPVLGERATEIARCRGKLSVTLIEDEGLRWSLVVSAYPNQEISLAYAASLLGLHPLELRERFIQKGVPLNLGPVDKADARAEVDALRAWKQGA